MHRSFKKAQTWHKKYDKCLQVESYFTAGDLVFTKLLMLMASAADRMAYEGDFEIPPSYDTIQDHER